MSSDTQTPVVPLENEDNESAASSFTEHKSKKIVLTPEQQKIANHIITALEMAPWNRRHLYFTIALMAALAFDYSKPATIGFVIPAMVKMFNISKRTASLLGVFGLLGTFVGSIFWGFIADRYGRRLVLVLTVIIFSLTSFCGLSTKFWETLLACFIMGGATGGEGPLTFTLAAEYIPARLRGYVILVLGFGGSVGGYAFAAVVAAVTKSIWDETIAWRAQWLIGIAPAVMIVLFRSKIIPGRLDEAKKSAESMLGGPLPEVLDEINQQTIETPKYNSSNEQGEDSSKLETKQSNKEENRHRKRIFGMTYFWRTFGLSFFSFCWGMANFGWSVWIPTLLASADFTPAKSSIYLSVASVLTIILLPITYYLFTRWSRRKMLCLYSAICSIALLALGIGGHLKVFHPVYVVIVNTTVLFTISSLGAAFPPYVSELFPTKIRGRRSGIIAGIGKAGGLIGMYAAGLWLANHSILWIMVVYAVFMIISAGSLFLTVEETEGKTLEHIDRL